MNGNQPNQNETPSDRPLDPPVAGQPLSFYWRTARWPALAAGIVEIILVIAGQPNAYLWGVNLVFFIGLPVWLKSKQNLIFGRVLALNVLTGLLIGLLVAAFRLVWERQLYLIFNLVTEPLVTAAGGFLIGALAFSGLGRSVRMPLIGGASTSSKNNVNRKEVSQWTKKRTY